LVGDLAGGVALFVEGGGCGLAEGVGSDPCQFVGLGWLRGLVDLGAEGGEVFEASVIGVEEFGGEPVVDFEAAGFDELDSGLGPVEGGGGLFAGEAGSATDRPEGEAEVAAGGAADGGEGGAE
jgi:hypothetical protein